jgi:cellulose synthase/poly-beta-1,6-N-acetylglucosamine synthase-like glycosyltransferase
VKVPIPPAIGYTWPAARLTPDFKPIRILEVEVGAPLPEVSPCDTVTGQAYERALILVRLHTRPLGTLELQLADNGLSADDLAKEIWRSLYEAICAHMRQEGLPYPATLGAGGLPSQATPRCVQEREELLAAAPFASIVVATRDRPTSLASCLRSLLSLDYPEYEVIVVDNAPSSTATADFVRHAYGSIARVRYIREDRAGVSWARNRGISEARGEIVAFTDDDIVVDKYWLVELARGMTSGKNVACVTGLVFPMELETQAQLWFEQFGGFGKGYTRQIFDLFEHRGRHRLFPYSTGKFGTGANMAFRTAALRAIGGFDPALGGGSLARGGEDLASYFQLIMAGYTLYYEPGAIVHHLHRRDYADLQKQMYGYGAGLTAYLTKCLIDNPLLVLDIAAKIPYGLVYALSSRSQKNARKLRDYPKELTSIERKGMLAGPFAYLRGRWLTRTMWKQSEPRGDLTQPSASPAPIAKELVDRRDMSSAVSPLLGRRKHALLKIPFAQAASETRSDEPRAPSFKPFRILDIEIGGRLPHVSSCEDTDSQPYERALALVRLHTRPVGTLELQLADNGLSAEDCARAIWRVLHAEIGAHMRQDGLPEPVTLDAFGLPSETTPCCVQAREAALANAPFVSIAVPTHDRSVILDACLRSLLCLDYPNYEIVVVDNAPSSSASADLIKHTYGTALQIRYVREDRRGVAWARIRGLREARGEIIAFADDDVIVDRYWLAELVKGFTVADNVGCVTGIVLPREIETQAQMWLEEYGCLDKGYTQRLFDLAEHRLKHRMYPYSAGVFGTGANMAFRTSVLRAAGGFDPALWVGGEDISAFFQIIVAGYKLVYEPAAIVRHLHRRDYAGLRKQLFVYGAGFTALLTKCLVDRPARLAQAVTWVPVAATFFLPARASKSAKRPPGFPRELVRIEQQGMLYGPLAYLRGRWKMRFVRKQPRSPEYVELPHE